MARIIVLGLGLVFLCASSAFSQLNSGSIDGVITDQSGAVVVGAKVSVVDVQRGVTRPLVSDGAGQYTAPSLTPGQYTIRAEAMGFKTAEHTGITVGVGQAVRVDVQLQPGAQQQTVTVTGEAPLVDASNEVVSNTVETTSLAELPINGGLYTKVMDFQPGIIGRPGGNSPNYSAHGAGGQDNYWMLDGVENVNMYINGGPLIGSATSNDELTILPLDAVQEVNVEANPTAEFGWMQGAVVNVGLKAGTNDIHGDAYGFGRNNSLEAYSPYEQGTGLPKADDNFENFGGSIGGPIKKDKLFYFGAFQGMRYTVGSPTIIATPSSSRSAPASDSEPVAIDALGTAKIPVSPLSLNLTGCNATLGAGGVPVVGTAACTGKGIFPNTTTNTENEGVSIDNIGHSNNVIGKIDYHPNEKNAINGDYLFGDANTTTPADGAAPWWTLTNLSRVQMVRASWIYTPNSNWVNEVRFGWNWYNLSDGNTECTANENFSSGNAGQPNYAALGFVSGAAAASPWCGFPAVTFGPSGYAELGTGFGVNDEGLYQQIDSAYDNVSYTRGKHQFKFGVEYHYTTYGPSIGTGVNLDGTINFQGGTAFGGSSPLQDFFAGATSGNSVWVNPVKVSVGFNRYAFYFTDDFRLSKRVTLNLGLRYELAPAWQIGNNQAANFDPTQPTGMVQQHGSALYNTDFKDLAPRAGFAWDITGKGTTVLRSGMGVSYDLPQVENLVVAKFGASLSTVPTGGTLVNTNGTTFPNPLAGAGGGIQSFNATGVAVPWQVGVPEFVGTGTGALKIGNGLNGNPAPASIYVKPVNAPRSPMYTWTLGIEHAFTNNISLTVNYLGTHAYNLSTEYNLNEPVLGATATTSANGIVSVKVSTKTLTAAQGAQASGVLGPYQTRESYANQFPWFAGIFNFGPGGYSNYNSLEVTFTQRAFHGLTMTENYSWAKDLGTTRNGNTPTVQDARCIACYYGLLTPLHHIGITATYAVPDVKSPAQLLQGWTINSTVNIQSGTPSTPADSSDDFAGIGVTSGGPGGANEVWSLVGNPRNFNLGKFALTPCYAFAGSKFAGPTNAAGNPLCQTLTLNGNNGAGQACITAANQEAVNTAMNAALALAPKIGGNPALPPSSGLASLEAVGCYVSPNGQSVILPPAQGTFGTMGKGALFGPAFYEWDFSVTKQWTIRERLGLQFRAEFFNFLNNETYSGGLSSLTNPATFGLATASPNNANPINGTGGPREVQLGLKATF